MRLNDLPTTEVRSVMSGWEYRAFRDDGTIIGGWAFTESEAERKAQEALHE
jgi:hypothetical protein